MDWPATADALVAEQERLAAEAPSPWTFTPGATIGGCFVAFARGEAGPGHPGDRAWAGAAVWHGGEAVVAGRVPAAYAPGLLALREGPILAAAVDALEQRPDVLLVDATGRDHARRAGLAVHLGAVLDVPTVGVTHRPLVGTGEEPAFARGDTTPIRIGDEEVARWVRTASAVRPVVAHAAWRTDPGTATAVVLACSTEAARTPIPLREARRVAREARWLSERTASGAAP